MEEKEVNLTDENAILKGKPGYRVVWEEEEEILPDEEEEEAKNPVEVRIPPDSAPDKVFPRKRPHHIHKHQQSIEYIAGILGFIILVFLIFVKPLLFWIVFFIILVTFAVFWIVRRYRTAYVDRMQQNIVYLKIKNPILTGFEVALGIGIFTLICILIGLVILVIFALGAGYGIWSILSGFFL